MNGPHEGSSISTIFSKLDHIIGKNRDIRVWNFSLGTNAETSENYISILGAELDRLQFKYDVLFVVSGSNSKPEDKNIHRLGSPADSLNSLVINSVTFDKKPASYSRRGPVLSFFIKPDICYYGGDQDKSLNVWGAFGQEKDSGTSYASAWISRKVAFLMEYMQLPREVTKALLIDSAAGWAEKDPKTNQKLM